jgi:hypothetical protein
MTAALEGGEWSAAHSGRTLPPGRTRYPLYRRLVGPVWTRAENLTPPPPGFDPRTVQPVVSRYTDWATGPMGQKVPLDFCVAIYTSVRLHTQYSDDVARGRVAGYQAVVLERPGSIRCNITPSMDISWLWNRV